MSSRQASHVFFSVSLIVSIKDTENIDDALLCVLLKDLLRSYISN